MRVLVITQKDAFVIPRNIQLLGESEFIDFIGACVVDSKHSIVNKKTLFIKSFGVLQVAKMSLKVLTNKLIDVADLLMGARYIKKKRSVKAVCKKYSVPYFLESDVNNEEFLSKISTLNV